MAAPDDRSPDELLSSAESIAEILRAEAGEAVREGSKLMDSVSVYEFANTILQELSELRRRLFPGEQ